MSPATTALRKIKTVAESLKLVAVASQGAIRDVLMMESLKRKKRDKRFYANAAKKAKRGKRELVPGQKGFLVFCNLREKEAVHEAYRILNEKADKLYGKEDADDDKEDDGPEDDDDDVDAAFEKEKQQLDRVASKAPSERRFQALDTGCQNLTFVRANVPSPTDLAAAIMEEAGAAERPLTKHLLRLVPVEATCKAYEESAAEAAKALMPAWFKDKGPVTYCIQYKSRMNTTFDREDAFRVIGGAVRECNREARVEFKQPDFVIVVEVMKGHCCIGVVRDYYKFKKYNIVELAGASKKQEVVETKEEPSPGSETEKSKSPDSETLTEEVSKSSEENADNASADVKSEEGT